MQCGATHADLKQLQQLVAGPNDTAWNAEYGVPLSSGTAILMMKSVSQLDTQPGGDSVRGDFPSPVLCVLDLCLDCLAGLPSSHTSLTLTYFLTLSGLLYQADV